MPAIVPFILLFLVGLPSIAILFLLWGFRLKLIQLDRDRQQSLVQLQASEQRLQLALEGTGQGIWDWDLNTRVLTWDDRCQQIFGLPRNTPVTYEWHLDALHPHDRQRVAEAGEQALRDRKLFDQEYRTLHPDGTIRWILARGKGYYTTGGEPYRMSGTVLDITERKQAEAELRERNEHIQILYETTRDLLSTDQPLQLVETVFTRLKAHIALDVYFNYSLNEESQLLHLDFYGGISEKLAQSIEYLEMGCAICGTVAQERRQIVQSHLQQCTDPKAALVKSLGFAAYSCQPLLAQGKLFGILGFGSFTRTEFKPAETELFQVICDQIAIALERAELLTSLQHRTRELTRLNLLKDEFLAALSHELRTPLNPILGWTKMMQNQRLNPTKIVEALEIIERNTRQQIALVDDLLDVSSVIQGKMQLHLQALDLAQPLQNAINTVQFAAQTKGIAIVQQGVTSLQMMGDRDRLQQVFWNLLSNAIKFTPENGQIEVTLSHSVHSAQVTVRDTGIGIEPEFLPHVFDYFRQADGSTTRKYGGLGLGLTIVQHLVELHGGTVQAESSAIAPGSTFIVTLPIELNHHTQSEQPQSLTAEVNLQSGIRILVVEDDPDNLELLRFLLQEDGLNVTAMTSPIAALNLIQTERPDAIVSDIGMPDMDGYEFIRQVRTLPEGREIPALALTAFARCEDREAALAAGFQAYITKPIDPIQFLTSLTQLIQEKQYSNPSK